ncbi:ankyrin repeat domain-containing protein [Legionella sp. W05-934-2]|jgi:hypothetical protein|uniref:ankyrin repeat domain-containing protein n=1 Tax=Legionella sp. W05-934-2 TaxID=1198649 RepID=UPI0034637714
MPSKKESLKGKRKTKQPKWLNDFQTSGTAGKLSIFQPEKKKIKSYSLKEKRQLLKNLNIKGMRPEDYLISPLDQSELVEVKPIHLLNQIEGKGLFAKQPIEEGTCVAEYTGEEYPSAKEFSQYLDSSDEANNHYAMRVGIRIVDAQFKGNFTRFINYSDTNDNVVFVEATSKGRKIVKVMTTQSMNEGEQFLVDYNAYDERASKEYLFLNPEDNDESMTQFLQNHQQHYQLASVPKSKPCLALYQGEMLMMTPLIQAMLSGKTLAFHWLETQSALPAVLVNEMNQPFDNREKDTLMPLMIAAAMGKTKYIQQLLDHGARVDRQQNHSGKTALLFALFNKRVNAVVQLIQAGANCLVHDRKDNTALHHAIDLLNAKQFKQVFDAFLKQTDDRVRAYNFINQDDEDIVSFCIRQGKFEHLRILLEAYPDYFEDSLTRGTKCDRKSNFAIIQQAIDNLSDPDDLGKLLEISEHFQQFINDRYMFQIQ